MSTLKVSTKTQTRSFWGASVSEVKAYLEGEIADGFNPTLAIAFVSIQNDLKDFQKLCADKGIQLVGATSSGEFTESQIGTQGFAVMFLQIKPDYFKTFQVETGPDGSRALGYQAGTFAKKHFENPVFISHNALIINADEMLAGMEEAIGQLPVVFGGNAGDDGIMRETIAFSSKFSTTSGATFVIFDGDKIDIQGIAVCGWEPIGTEYTITKSAGNVLYEIDGEPAINVFKRYFGEYQNIYSTDGKASVAAAQYPLHIQRDGQVILRSPLTTNEEDGSMVLAGHVKEGDKFRFSVAPGFEIVDETIRGLRDFHKKYPDCAGMLMYSCTARHISLGPMIEDEVFEAGKIWNVPMVGFFTYGEICTLDTGRCYFLNETCCLVLIREK